MSEETTTQPSAADFSKQSRQIWLGGFGLMAGSAISFAIYNLFASTTSHIVLGLMIAALQVSFQLFVFMHLKNERGLVYKFLVFTAFFTFALFFLTNLAHSNPLLSKAIPVPVK
jgi:heme/copper-type cytochrome/quinol oxidase subunit 4